MVNKAAKWGSRVNIYKQENSIPSKILVIKGGINFNACDLIVKMSKQDSDQNYCFLQSQERCTVQELCRGGYKVWDFVRMPTRPERAESSQSGGPGA